MACMTDGQARAMARELRDRKAEAEVRLWSKEALSIKFVGVQQRGFGCVYSPGPPSRGS